MVADKGKIAVLGGSGDIGRVVCAELARLGSYGLVVAGRNLERAEALAATLPTGTEVRRFDVGTESGDAFRDCALIVNCTGPSWRTGPLAAAMALHAGAHLVDVGGYSLLMGELAGRGGELEAAGRSFVLSAGWMPGLSEVFVRHALERAEGAHGPAESVVLYCGARDTWSLTSAEDMVWHVFSELRFGWFERGVWSGRPVWAACGTVTLPVLPDARQQVTWMYNAPSRPLAEERRDLSLRIGLVLVGPRCRFALAFSRLFLSRRRKTAAAMLHGAIRRDAERRGPMGLLHAEVRSRSGRTFRLTLAEARNHWITGLSAAHAAHAVMQGLARPGVHYLGEAVPARAFMESLAARGVACTEDAA